MSSKFSLCLTDDTVDGRDIEFIAIGYEGILFARGPNIPKIEGYLRELVHMANKQIELEQHR